MSQQSEAYVDRKPIIIQREALDGKGADIAVLKKTKTRESDRMWILIITSGRLHWAISLWKLLLIIMLFNLTVGQKLTVFPLPIL